ncbi:Cu2+-exporting ATPase [Silvibacterium bohemicum]|uniref:Cu2+-exporting ATPase n=1 Tax=Silvibacterium bohemicum TaxID=1577686 RepID=A0A841JST6_9BACT|nr:heavy metal translocating P-type ATPase [Silvibacterium bohemicum]MBB6144376.1 Cu2+-exporting ATPase [Silvibacterium bohemicum]
MTHEPHGQGMDPHAGHDMSKAHGNHDRHAGHSVAMFRDKFWLSLALTIPVVVWSADVQHWLGYTVPSFPGSKFIPAILGTAVFVYGGLVFVRGAWRELADRKPGMMTLISLAILVSFGTSLAATLGFFEVEVWWELASLITIMILGHWLEMRAISQASGALNALAALLPDTAERVTGDQTQTVPLSALQVGDIILVRPGARVAADGIVVDGAADVDESMITGESRTVPKASGAKVIAGTVASGGSLRVRITAVGEQTALSGIMQLVATAQASGSRSQALADRAAAVLFYVAVASGAITFVYWWLAGDKEHALIRTATVLIIACPHALGLAIPLVIAISTSIGAQNGLLVKDRLALERARNLDTVIFDKTGTLTRGLPALSGVVTVPGGSESELLAYAAAVEANSEHPLGKAIIAEAKRRNLATVQAADFKSLAGRGAEAEISGKRVSIGGPRLLVEGQVTVPAEVERLTAQWASEGKTVLHVVADGKLMGAFAVEDEIRPESKEAIEELHRLGIRVAMITGDSKAVADSVANRIGIDEVAAEVLPADKAAAVKHFQGDGKKVAMVGDGVNDAPALATADVGIAIGAGTDVAIESAGIVLVRNDPRDVVGAIELSRATYRKMIQNLVWATAYNLVAIPVAAGLFVHWGFDLPMSVGAIAMSLSTIIVAANAQLLRRLNLQRVAL